MPRAIAARRRVLAARRRRAEPETAPAATRKSRPAGWPSRITHTELDELARTHGVAFDVNASKADKQAALEAAGVGPP